MIQANVHQAKTNLSKLIERAEAGEEVVIARNGKPAVRLTPVVHSSTSRRIYDAAGDELIMDSDHASGAAPIASGPVPLRRRDVVGCMDAEVSALSEEAWRRLGVEIAADMSNTAKFDVELDDSLEFIPAAQP